MSEAAGRLAIEVALDAAPLEVGVDRARRSVASLSGPLVFIGVSDVRDGVDGVSGNVTAKNGFLHMVVPVAGHEIDAVEEIYLGDEAVNVASLVNGYPTAGMYANYVDADVEATWKDTLAANATMITLPSTGANSLIVTVEDGESYTTITGGGEGGNDATGRAILPNGGIAGTVIAGVTLTNATTVSVPAVNRSRKITVHYLSKGTPRSRVRMAIHRGEATQAADPFLIASCPNEWTSNHILKDVAYVYVRLEYSAKLFPNGVPNIKALIRGKKVADPRGGTYPNNTAWSSNYALCALDYIRSPYGLNCPDADINLDQVKVAANICDETVSIRASGPLPTTQKRYEAHGVIQLDHDVEQNLRALSTAGGGPVPLITSGKFEIPVGYYSTPVSRVLTESDLRAPVKVRPRTSRRDLFNAVGGTYVDGRVSWQATDFPEVVNAFYQSQDAGEKIKRDLTLPFTTDEIMAQRLAKIALERSRQAITVDFPGKPCCFPYTVGDLVPVTLAKFGWANKVFRVVGWNMNSNGTVDLVLQEDAPGIYDWNMGQATTTDLANDTNLPNPSYIAPMGALTVSSGASELVMTGDGTIVSRLKVGWAATTDPGIINGGEFQVRHKKVGDTEWTSGDKVSGAANATWLLPVVDTETYIVAVRAVNARGIPNDWVYVAHTVVGNSAAPPNVAGFALSVRADGTRHFKWTTNTQPINVTNGGGYRIRYRAAGASTTWDNMTPLHAGLLSVGELQTLDPVAGKYDFAIVAVNANRKESTTPAFITAASVGREPVDYSASSNLILNSDWQMSNGIKIGENALHGWALYYAAANARPYQVMRNNRPYNPGGGGASVMHTTLANNASGVLQPATGAATSAYLYNIDPVAIFAGAMYEVSVMVNPTRCAAELRLEWFNKDGSGAWASMGLSGFIDSFDGSSGDAGLGGWQAGHAGMVRLWGTQAAPAGALGCRVILVKYGTNAGNVDSFAFWNRAMLCVARPGVTRSSASPWIESSYDQLHGGSLANLSVDTAQIANEASTSARGYINPGETVLYGSGYDATGLGNFSYTATADCTVTLTEQDKNEFHMRLVQLEMEMKANTRITAGLQEDMTVLLDILGTAKSGLKVLGGLGNLLKWAAGIVTAGGVLWGIFHGQWPK